MGVMSVSLKGTGMVQVRLIVQLSCLFVFRRYSLLPSDCPLMSCDTGNSADINKLHSRVAKPHM